MADEQKFFYANSIEIAYGPFDLSMKFMRNGTPIASPTTTPVPTGKLSEVTAVILDTLIVSMSPSHAKAILPALYNAILAYEKNCKQKLPLPADIQATFDATFPDKN